MVVLCPGGFLILKGAYYDLYTERQAFGHELYGCSHYFLQASDVTLTFLAANAGVMAAADRYKLIVFVRPEGNRYSLHVKFCDQERIMMEWKNVSGRNGFPDAPDTPSGNPACQKV